MGRPFENVNVPGTYGCFGSSCSQTIGRIAIGQGTSLVERRDAKLLRRRRTERVLDHRRALPERHPGAVTVAPGETPGPHRSVDGRVGSGRRIDGLSRCGIAEPGVHDRDPVRVARGIVVCNLAKQVLAQRSIFAIQSDDERRPRITGRHPLVRDG